jgi:hypothetical protein
MNETQQPPSARQSAEPQPPSKPVADTKAKIHRVCIGCNNMFEVTMENYEVKHCPSCRKE